MNDIDKLIEQAKLYIPSGASFTGDISDIIRRLMQLSGDELMSFISTRPGSFVRTKSENDPGISLATPIGYDVWYLYQTENVLDFEDQERTDEILERLNPFLSALQGIRPLKTLRQIEDLSFINRFWVPRFKSYWENAAPYMIKVMRYESILEGRSFKYYSDGQPAGSIGYLAFPIGQLGVMEIISLIGESITEDDTFSLEAQESIVAAGEMMAPVHDNRGFCAGTHLIEDGYLIQHNKIEIMAEDFEGQTPIEPHRWLRYWLMPEDTFPIPGEFVALLAKSELFHVNWFQETFPLLYSGQYWENEYYTSGIIKEVIEPNEESDEETSIYKVWVRGYEMYLRPSDFAEYKVDDRVTIVKEIMGLGYNMDWTLINDSKNNNSSSINNPDPDWRIVPISFYE